MISRHFLILDGIMQERGDDEIGILSLGRRRNKRGNFQQVVDVGRRRSAFSLLVNMPPRGGIRCAQHCDPSLCHRLRLPLDRQSGRELLAFVDHFES